MSEITQTFEGGGEIAYILSFKEIQSLIVGTKKMLTVSSAEDPDIVIINGEEYVKAQA